QWLEGIERIFGAMRCQDEHRVMLGGYVLHDEADHWFVKGRQEA
ncbi:hypothetical protein A2U01_0110845, partial [Trifolium medium]|nr:hypothetical protein [Trifolium medium]